MRANQFRYLQHFNENENWGNLDKVQWYHIQQLNLIRANLKSRRCDWPMIIHGCYSTTGHSPKSDHYQGKATDFHFVTSAFNLVDQFFQLEKTIDSLGLTDFLTVGVYHDWANNGFHIGSRGSRLRWTRINGEYVYGTTVEITDLVRGFI